MVLGLLFLSYSFNDSLCVCYLKRIPLSSSSNGTTFFEQLISQIQKTRQGYWVCRVFNSQISLSESLYLHTHTRVRAPLSQVLAEEDPSKCSRRKETSLGHSSFNNVLYSFGSNFLFCSFGLDYLFSILF